MANAWCGSTTAPASRPAPSSPRRPPATAHTRLRGDQPDHAGRLRQRPFPRPRSTSTTRRARTCAPSPPREPWRRLGTVGPGLRPGWQSLRHRRERQGSPGPGLQPDGTLARSMGAPEKLSFPNGIVVDAQGNIEVSDSNNGRLVVFSPYGKMLATISRGVGEGDLGLPRGGRRRRRTALCRGHRRPHGPALHHRQVEGDAHVHRVLRWRGAARRNVRVPERGRHRQRAHIYVTDRENNRVQVWGY